MICCGDIPHGMGDSIYSPIHKVTVRFFIEKRKALGLRQADLAKLVHRSRYWVSDLELGRRRIDHAEYIRICRARGIAPGRFMTRRLEPLPDNNARTGAIPRNRANAGAKTRR